MRSITRLRRTRHVLAGHLRRHPFLCLAEMLGVSALLLLVSGSAATLARTGPEADTREPATVTRVADAHADDAQAPAWVWKKRASRDSPLYAFGTR